MNNRFQLIENRVFWYIRFLTGYSPFLLPVLSNCVLSFNLRDGVVAEDPGEETETVFGTSTRVICRYVRAVVKRALKITHKYRCT